MPGALLVSGDTAEPQSLPWTIGAQFASQWIPKPIWWIRLGQQPKKASQQTSAI